MTEQRMFGLWDSPVTAKSLSVSLRLGEPCWDTDGRTLGWIEGRSDRGVIVVQDADGGATRDLTADISVRAFVGYGGGDFTLAHGDAYFVGQADQRIYRQSLAGGAARPITPAFGACTTPVVSPDGKWLAYVHTYEEVDCIAIVDTAGRHWPTKVGTGRDFYMQPAWNPAGDTLAWVEWDHPNMPWDSSELKTVRLAFPEGGLPVVAGESTLAGGPELSIFQPIYAPNGDAVYVSDAEGWGNIYRRNAATGAVSKLTSQPGEFGEPAWNHAQKRLAVTPAGRIVCIRSEGGFDRLTVIDPDGTVRDLGDVQGAYTSLGSPVASPASERVAMVASGPTQPTRVVVFDLSAPASGFDVRRRADSETVPQAAYSMPRALSWPSFDGELAHGLYFPPTSQQFTAEGAPPVIVLVHGGPTSQYTASWRSSQQAQFFATRGYGVLVPNYRGSTGYGREYMLKLRASWGIYDVEDSKTGAEYLVREGLADPTRLIIMGGSAGGFTVLQSLCEIPGFYRAALCLFGVANQFLLAADTHKFEARYLDSLLGPLPEAAAIYRERSPYFHAHKIKDPIAVFQGEIDRVVPRNQSDEIVASLRSRGVPHEYHVYPGEGHGWRKAETIEQFYGDVLKFLRQYVIYS